MIDVCDLSHDNNRFSSNDPYQQAYEMDATHRIDEMMKSISTKSNRGPPAYHKTKWTRAEDDLLAKSVAIHGTKNWTAVSALVPRRNPKQCRERWTTQTNPELIKDDWTKDEDRILLSIQKRLGNSWAKIALSLPGRSSNAVKNRFNWLSKRNSYIYKNHSKKPFPIPLISMNAGASSEEHSCTPDNTNEDTFFKEIESSLASQLFVPEELQLDKLEDYDLNFLELWC